MEWIDISLEISPDVVVWPGSPKTELHWRRSMERGDKSNNSNLMMNNHTGTHVDAPLHFIAEGDSVESLSLQKMIGEVFLIDLSDKQEIKLDDLQSGWPDRKVERVLLKTKNSLLWENPSHSFVENFTALKEAETRWLLQQGIVLVGIDYLSIQTFQGSPLVHQLLLETKTVVIEGLDLRKVGSGFYDLVCLPLKIKGAEGAPARVILRGPKNYEN